MNERRNTNLSHRLSQPNFPVQDSSPSTVRTWHSLASPSPQAIIFFSLPHQHLTRSVTEHGRHSPSWQSSWQTWLRQDKGFSHLRPQDRLGGRLTFPPPVGLARQ